MTTTRSAATAAPVFATLGGKRYRLSPLSQLDQVTYTEWVKGLQRVADEAELSEIKDQTDREVLLKHAFDRRQRLTFLSEECLSRIGTLEGVAKLGFLMAAHNHDDLTEEAMIELCKDPHNARRVADAMNSFYEHVLMKLKSEKKGADQKGPKKKRGGRRQPIPTRRQT